MNTKMINKTHDIFRDLYKDIESLHRKTYYGHRAILDDFCTMAMGSHHNMLYTLGKVPVPPYYKEKYDFFEKEYEDLKQKYKKFDGAMDDFAVFLCKLTKAMTENPADYLGMIYMESNSNSKCNGQFFTPMHICELMAKITYSSKEVFEKEIEENGYIVFNDPACGSGALAIGFNSLIEEYDIKNPDTKILYQLGDIDFTCIKMAFIQLTLMGLSARIEWGDALFNHEEHTMYDSPCLQVALRLGYFRPKKKVDKKEGIAFVVDDNIREKLNQMELF